MFPKNLKGQGRNHERHEGQPGWRATVLVCGAPTAARQDHCVLEFRSQVSISTLNLNTQSQLSISTFNLSSCSCLNSELHLRSGISSLNGWTGQLPVTNCPGPSPTRPRRVLASAGPAQGDRDYNALSTKESQSYLVLAVVGNDNADAARVGPGGDHDRETQLREGEKPKRTRR